MIEPEKDPFPSEKAPKRGVVAPWPSVEKYPVIIGSNLTFQYASSAMRSAMGGYRRNFVDLVCELLDHDPDTFNAINKRVLSIASARVELEAADPADATSVDVCERIKKLHKGIDGRVEAMARLQWGVIFGVAAEELLWRPQLDDNGSPTGKLELYGTLMIHSRRLGYPDPSKWKLCIWDQGPYDDSHSTIWGLGLSDIPNKFAVHSPSMRADYPTREGVGRILVTYMMLKRMVLRATAQDFERFIKPWVIATYKTGLQGDARQATDEDMQVAEANARALGSGMGSTAIIPDSISFELVQSIGKMTVSEFVEYLDKGILKCVVGSTHSTQPGKYGSRDTARVGREDTQDMFAYDATALASTWKRDVIRAMTLEEFGPAVARKHTPEVSIVIEDRSSPAERMGIVTQAVSVGMPVDADKVAARVGVPITPKQGEEPRILVPVAPAMPNQVFEQLPEPPQPEVTQQEA